MTGHNLTRRRFLGMAGLAAGAVALGPTLSACTSHSGSVYDALSRSDDPSTSVHLGVDMISFVSGAVLAAAGGAHLRRSATSPSTIELVQADRMLATLGSPNDPEVVNFVSDATFAPDGTIWIVDRGNRTLVHLDDSLGVLATHTSLGDTQLRSPFGVASLSDGRLVVTDTRTGVHLVTASGATSSTLRSTALVTVPDGDGGTTNVAIVPTSVHREVAITADDQIVVHDRSNGSSPRILRFDADGSQAAAPAPVAGITTALAVGSRGDVFTLDSSSRTVNRTAPDGSTTTVSLHHSGGSLALRAVQGGRASFDDTSTATPIGLAVDRSTGDLLIGMPILAHDFHVHRKGNKLSSPSTTAANS